MFRFLFFSKIASLISMIFAQEKDIKSKKKKCVENQYRQKQVQSEGTLQTYPSK